MIEQWEHLSFELDWKENPDSVLQWHGKTGYQLVAVIPCIPAVGSTWKHRYIMKRKQDYGI